MRHRSIAALIGAGFILAASASLASAQQPPARIRGSIEKLDGDMLHIKSREGGSLEVRLAEKANIAAVVKASLSDIKPGTFVGVAAVPGPNGTLKAVEVLIFPDAMKGSNEGHYGWDLLPESTMTNATVVDSAAKVEGQTLTLKYKDGEKAIAVPPDAPVVTFAPGTRDDLKPGAGVFIGAAPAQPDGVRQAARVNVGRGINPPM